MTETNAKKSAVFALRLAWKINKKVFLAWVFASVALSVLPAIVLVLNREVISTISGFLASGEGAFSDVVGSILLLGLFVAVNGLSGGQWQKLALTRALWRNKARIMVLDEPTATLDPIAEADIYKNFAAITGGRTTLLVSHRLGVTSIVDRILVFRDGEIVEDGSHRELLQKNGYYAELYHAQAKWYTEENIKEP